RTLFNSLAAVLWFAFVAGAAQEPYDIDLKDLRKHPERRVKQQRTPHESKKPVTATPATDGDSSSYTVQPGDHLFLILMRRYGLSNDAAEQLIPEIMRQNGIRNPKGLTVGQRLIIPLPAPATSKTAQHVRMESRRTPHTATAAVQPQAVQPQAIQPQTVQPQTVQPQTVQPQAAQPQAAQPQAAQTPNAREVVVSL